MWAIEDDDELGEEGRSDAILLPEVGEGPLKEGSSKRLSATLREVGHVSILDRAPLVTSNLRHISISLPIQS